jgi:hypothetical protein
MRARAKMVLLRDAERLTYFVPSPEVVPLLCFVQGTMNFTIYTSKKSGFIPQRGKKTPSAKPDRCEYTFLGLMSIQWLGFPRLTPEVICDGSI